MMHLLRRSLDCIYVAAAWLAALCLAAIGILILAQVIGRWFGVLVPAAEEFAGFLMAAATFLALAWTLRSGGHVRVTLLIRNLSPRARRAQEIAIRLIGLPLAASLAWSSIALVVDSFQYGETSSGYVAVPLWIPQLPMALGFLILAVALLDECIGMLHGKPLPRADEISAAGQGE